MFLIELSQLVVVLLRKSLGGRANCVWNLGGMAVREKSGTSPNATSAARRESARREVTDLSSRGRVTKRLASSSQKGDHLGSARLEIIRWRGDCFRGGYSRSSASLAVFITRFQSHKGLQFYSEWRAKLPPFRIKLRTQGFGSASFSALSGEAKLRQADIG